MNIRKLFSIKDITQRTLCSSRSHKKTLFQINEKEAAKQLVKAGIIKPSDEGTEVCNDQDYINIYRNNRSEDKKACCKYGIMTSYGNKEEDDNLDFSIPKTIPYSGLPTNDPKKKMLKGCESEWLKRIEQLMKDHNNY
jgi:hypothetical protein